MDLLKMSMEEIWTEIDNQLNENRGPIEEMNTTYSLELTGDEGGVYGLKFADGQAEIINGDPGEVDCSLKMRVGDFKKLLAGNLNSTASFMMGKLKVKGNIGLALKLENVLKEYQF
ncbi:SCP2 sterol-binding domain-containing protein [Sporosarcina thermotolerans]|uniref:SCP2 sterol-binding domain-containing protein n=1 Tax=Sporosarcina thermotolerans TaxID=633404 RepID=A0AAW9AB63_9BACL|nr:SCP2 sterol-binding domain-containing protein [Sporosarcina thermotolerans]MDW0116893.1 SCP2 sterol-binding domain-containing protein [Sporosarcina thermotolerans]WHT47982.1 SCP2 sterol-binding domain-containing protein [Sporosarcina thermotolerans]